MSPPRSPAPPPLARTALQLREAATAARRRGRSDADANPLRQGLRLERVPDPCAFVLFGATGDLAHRKVLPAIYQLWRTNLLPAEFSLVAVARRPYTDAAFAVEVHASLEKYSRVQPIDEGAWTEFAQRISYQQLDFADDVGFDRLGVKLDELDQERGTAGNRLFYLATQPSQVTEIVRQLGRVGLDHEMRGAGWRRLIVEKPFGRDLESARLLNHEVNKVFRESQVYRIDHYLGKETVRNLLVFRFGNGIFEPVWNRSYVDHVQITVAESIGVEGRGAFYEETGASRDILQNHLLQLMTLVAMEPPSSFQADALRDQKLQVLRAIAAPDLDHIRRDVVRGQYGPGWIQAEPQPGYRQEPEVDPESETETFVAGRFTIDDWRWSGIPFYLRAGKRLPKRATEIAIQFKDVPLRLFRESVGRSRAQRPGDAHPARRGDHAALRGQGTGPRPGRSHRQHGLRLRHLVRRGFAGCVRDPHPRCAAGRRFALHSSGRGGGRLVRRYADHQRLGRHARAKLSQLRGRFVGTGGGRRADGTGRTTVAQDLTPPRPVAHSVPEIEGQLGKLWARAAVARVEAAKAEAALIEAQAQAAARAAAALDAARETSDAGGHHVAARTSVLNLVVVAGEAAAAERCAATIAGTAGRHASRSLILSAVDPQGPPGLEARIEALSLTTPDGRAETGAETIHVAAHGETGQHLASIIVPLLVHDLPVALWWPGDPPFGSHRADRLLPIADRLIVDGSAWCGDGLDLLGPAGRRRRGAPPGRRGLGAAAPGPLARGSRLRLRPAGPAAASRRGAPHRRGVRGRRAGRPGRADERGSAALPRRLAGVAAGHDRGRAAPPRGATAGGLPLSARGTTRWK